MTREISDAEFDSQVLKSDKPVLVDFWAPWCGPCKMLAPIIDQVSEELSGQVEILKCNIEENPEAPSKYGVRSIPTLMLFKGGELADTKIGSVKKDDLHDWIKSNI